MSNGVDFFSETVATGTLVVVLQNGGVAIWEEMAEMFKGRFEPSRFPETLKSPDSMTRLAVSRFLREILQAVRKNVIFGNQPELGQAFSDGVVHRLKFDGNRTYCCGVIPSTDIRGVMTA